MTSCQYWQRLLFADVRLLCLQCNELTNWCGCFHVLRLMVIFGIGNSHFIAILGWTVTCIVAHVSYIDQLVDLCLLVGGRLARVGRVGRDTKFRAVSTTSRWSRASSVWIVPVTIPTSVLFSATIVAAVLCWWWSPVVDAACTEASAGTTCNCNTWRWGRSVVMLSAR